MQGQHILSTAKYKNIFLHSKLVIDTKEKVNIILSPEYYWCRVFELPMNSKKEVLNVLPSLFEDFVDITNLKFYVKKLEDNRYLCFGDDESKILDIFKNKKISTTQIVNIYFGQIELESLVKTSNQTCMKVDNVCLSYIDDILVQIPIILKVNIDNDLDIDNINLSKDKIYINSHSKYIEPKYSYMLSLFFILLSVVIFSKTMSNNSIITNIPKNIEVLKEKYNMPSTSIQTKSIIKKIDKIVKNQSKIRDAFYYILSFKKRNDIQILNIEIKSNNIKCKLKYTTMSKIKQFISKKYKVSTAKINNDIIMIGFKI